MGEAKTMETHLHKGKQISELKGVPHTSKTRKTLTVLSGLNKKQILHDNHRFIINFFQQACKKK